MEGTRVYTFNITYAQRTVKRDTIVFTVMNLPHCIYLLYCWWIVLLWWIMLWTFFFHVFSFTSAHVSAGVEPGSRIPVSCSVERVSCFSSNAKECPKVIVWIYTLTGSLREFSLLPISVNTWYHLSPSGWVCSGFSGWLLAFPCFLMSSSPFAHVDWPFVNVCSSPLPIFSCITFIVIKILTYTKTKSIKLLSALPLILLIQAVWLRGSFSTGSPKLDDQLEEEIVLSVPF